VRRFVELLWPGPQRVRRLHRGIVYPVLAFVLPSVCFRCGSILGPFQLLGACPACWAALHPLGPWICRGCALPRPAQTDLLGPIRGRCAACMLDPSPADETRATVAYGAAARALLLRAKLGGRPELLQPMGHQLARMIETAGMADSCTAVVPVPSHPWINLRRGFVPAVELARPLARRLGLPLCRRVLRRRAGSPLAAKRLGARGRRALAAVEVRRDVVGQRLLLVDDVMTTGATVHSCARALKQHGASEVRVAVWARTLPGGRAEHTSDHDRR